MRIALLFVLIATSNSAEVSCCNSNVSTEVPPFRNWSERRAATWAMNKTASSDTDGIPEDLAYLIQTFAVNNGWLTLENAFHRTERTAELLDMVQGRRKKVASKGLKFRDGNTGDITHLVETDGNGTITALDLSRQGLTDEDIVGDDLSRMPEGVTELNLSDNNLRCIKLKSSSKLLKRLNVHNNKLQRRVDISELPVTLQSLIIHSNQLKVVDLGSRNKALKFVDVRCNPNPKIAWDDDVEVEFQNCLASFDPSSRGVVVSISPVRFL